MGAIPREEAGIGSAVNDAGQEIGTAFGVAVLGSVVTAVYAGALPDDVRGPARHSLGEALMVGDPGLANAARDAFVDGLAVASLVGAATSLVAVVVALTVLRARTSAEQHVREDVLQRTP